MNAIRNDFNGQTSTSNPERSADEELNVKRVDGTSTEESTDKDTFDQQSSISDNDLHDIINEAENLADGIPVEWMTAWTR